MPSIVPSGPSQDVFLVLDQFGERLGRAWRETDENGTEYETVIRHLLEGQCNNPVRVVLRSRLRRELMKGSSSNNQSDIEPSSSRYGNLGTWAVIPVLLAFLIAAGVIGYLGWISTDNDVPKSGYLAMALGVVFSLAVGGGLMALLFYSSRRGYDEPAELVQEPDRDEGQGTSQLKDT
jgi:hypothetical protein